MHVKSLYAWSTSHPLSHTRAKSDVPPHYVLVLYVMSTSPSGRVGHKSLLSPLFCCVRIPIRNKASSSQTRIRTSPARGNCKQQIINRFKRPPDLEICFVRECDQETPTTCSKTSPPCIAIPSSSSRHNISRMQQCNKCPAQVKRLEEEVLLPVLHGAFSCSLTVCLLVCLQGEP